MPDLALYLAAGRAAHPIADWAIDQMLTYGPGVILIGALYGLYCTSDAVRARRAARRRLIAEVQQMAQMRDAVNEALADHQDAFTTDTRKEKP